MPSRRRRNVATIEQHIAAIRAFHMGLLAETQRRLHLMGRIAPQIDALADSSRSVRQRLAAAEGAFVHVRTLGTFVEPWRAVYRDLRRHLRQLRTQLRQLANKRRTG